MTAFLHRECERVKDASEEAFLIVSASNSNQDLGMVDPTASSLDLSVAGKDYHIVQSPGILRSSRPEGTTGAVLWKTTLRVAEWIGSYQNPLIHGGVLSPASTILELGCGVSAVLATSLSQWVSRYIATDQRYVLKLFEQNLRENAQQNVRRASEMDKSYSIEFLPLDWELDEIIQVCHVLDQDERSAGKGKNGGLDVVIACDCVYNEVLVEPFVETCRSLCSMRYADNAPQSMIPTLCVVAQQVRSSEVLELFLANMCRFFDVYRAKDGVLSSELSLGSGFTVHLAVLSQERDWTSDR